MRLNAYRRIALESARRCHRVCIETHLAPAPRGRMSGKAALQCRVVIIGAAGLGNLRTLYADRHRTLVAGPHDCDVTRFVVAMILIGCDNQVAAIGIRLRFDRIAHGLPALLRAFVLQPIVLRIREQDLPVLRWAQNVYAQFFRRRGDERAAMRMLARGFFRLAVRLAAFPMHVLPGWPTLLDVQRVDACYRVARRGADLDGETDRAEREAKPR